MRTAKQHQKKAELPLAHFVPGEFVNPYNPVTVNLIGAGGTGGQMLTALARMNHALIALERPGLFVRVYDDDKVDPFNLGRQLFTTAEVGQYKAVALVSRVNRFFGTNWKAETVRFDEHLNVDEEPSANINISCVDTVAARFNIAEILKRHSSTSRGRSKAIYWMDLGNSRSSGQVILSTLDKVRQPNPVGYLPVGRLALITEEYKDLLENLGMTDETPSCSMAEALAKQDLFINSALANCGASLLWQMLREGMLRYCGFFLNLETLRSQPIPLG
jgi:PRTRC genetic system ThiF family protein